MSVIVRNKHGQRVVLLNPFEKGQKMFNELRENVHLTNDGHVKTDKHGKPVRLNDTQRAYRGGYLAAQRDSRRAFRSKHPKYVNKNTIVLPY